KFLSAADLKGKAHILTMKNVTMEEVGQDKDTCPVLYFEDAKKGLVLNKTNGGMIASVYGDDSDNWASGKIELYPTTTPFGGKMVECIRVRKPSAVDAAAVQQPAQPTAAIAEEAAMHGLDDGDPDIPF
ncbi:unnamed protein product, partial [marine sediment metagenome]